MSLLMIIILIVVLTAISTFMIYKIDKEYAFIPSMFFGCGILVVLSCLFIEEMVVKILSIITCSFLGILSLASIIDAIKTKLNNLNTNRFDWGGNKISINKFTCPFCIQECSVIEILNDDGSCKCPKCGKTIPDVALQTPNLPFSIIGVSNSGKTNFITVMLHELNRSPGLRLVLGSDDKETLGHQKANYERIYEDHKVPESTASGTIMPQIWYVKNLMKESKSSDTVPTYTFTIFDGAGEDHENNLDMSSPICRYIQASKAIILTLDPLILPGIRKGGIIDEKTLINSLAGSYGETKNAIDVVNSISSYFRVAKGINVSKKLDIPIAVVLTKFDTVLSHKFFTNTLVKSPSLNISDGKVHIEEIKQIDEEIRNWLVEIGEGAFINALLANFKEFTFFGVSSYGKPPNDDHTLNSIMPHRVLDPILWLFNKANFID